uniref:Uncharacterized protein n=1 Tax=Micrurus corallinus TaxID=54390 RepID=A0A2D4FHE3_MICCO
MVMSLFSIMYVTSLMQMGNFGMKNSKTKEILTDLFTKKSLQFNLNSWALMRLPQIYGQILLSISVLQDFYESLVFESLKGLITVFSQMACRFTRNNKYVQ